MSGRNILLVGPEGAGKSCLVNDFLDKQGVSFSPSHLCVEWLQSSFRALLCVYEILLDVIAFKFLYVIFHCSCRWQETYGSPFCLLK